MNINKTEENGIAITTLEETRLDAAVAPSFKKAMEAMIDGGSTQIILDLSRLTFMDSSSLGAMVGVMKYLGNKGKMVVVGANGSVMDLFKLTRMNKVFTMADDIDSAKAIFAG